MRASLLPPVYRGLSFIIGVVGIMISNNLYLLISAFLVILMFLCVQGNLMKFAKFGLTTILPVFIILVLIWGFVRKEWPGVEKSWEFGVLFAICTALRLALLAGIFLVAIFSLSPEELTHLFRTFGVRGRVLAVIVSCMNLWSDFQFYIRQVYVARCGRGLMPNRRFVTRLRQFPFAVRTLFISTLMLTIDRADTWESVGLIERLERFSQDSTGLQARSELLGILLLALSVFWASIAALCFFYL
ncbi:MAG: hypothetical protein C5B47_04355 [Verrucomicrobia bacterium]|nr:MAG: hypothetical protein C5B47_04355 [Verrucomicrobiota bacterium]